MSTLRPRRASSRPARTRARGFTLIEVLVSLLVFSVGILGMAGLQAMSTRTSVDASERSRAALMANELIAQMWQARDTSLSEDVVQAWGDRLADTTVSGLLDGKGVITELDDAAGSVLITITWTSPVRDNVTSTYITEFAMPPDTE
ncbi:type IV pilus modification protein PilV [Ideonella sp. YS5]|uniref:type IV pilus modification protein PilV n=1 Tax=Ideonella sp. YS5 TaxID=3453714 RepID=UPI003EEED4AB